MDDEITRALSRLLLVSGSSTKAKEYLEAFIQEELSDFASLSTPFTDGADLEVPSAAAILPPLFSSPTANPWEDGDDTLTRAIKAKRPSQLSPPFEPTSHLGIRFDEEDKDGERRTSRGSTNGSPAWGGVRSFPGPSPSMSSVRPQYDRTPTANVLDSPLSHSTEETHSPTASLLLLASDQPLPARNSPFVPRRPERTGRGAPSVTAPPLPPQSHRTPENWSTLHPELAAIRWNESSLSKKEFSDLKSKILSDPDYVGAVPYIRVLNPQYTIRILVHTPPKTSDGKWYQVTKGTAVGIFNTWAAAAKATQGVRKSVYKSFRTREAAIIDYQAALLRGDVLLMNEKATDGKRELGGVRKGVEKVGA